MIDPLYKIEIKNLLNKLKTEKGILITDHYYEDVLDITSKNLLIKNGVGIPIESKEDLKRLEYLGKS
jgi:ABC-type lipopolysaccharide export system ATPase subunit